MYSPNILIAKKQNGESFTDPEIEFIINGYTSGEISDNEMSIWLKAVFDHGMNHEETIHYTRTMLNSGVTLDFSHLNGFVVDKHSTGGVGDKVSLVLAPLLAACGCYVPMLAGRALEHTGGTIDKLETIPGYKTSLDIQSFIDIVDDVGVSIMSQTVDICPADRKIYTLRDVTSTVGSLPLICGSIMSKKIAEGLEGLVLDVKVGNGAFMKSLDDAQKLGILLKEVGELYGLKVSVCFTDMNQPLGNTAGLWNEVMESIECLKGNGPDNVMQVVYHLGEEAMKLAGVQNPEKQLRDAISDGSALNKFREMVNAHGGSLESLDDPNMNSPKFIEKIYAKRDGYIGSMNTRSLGLAIVHLGGGRICETDKLDSSVGIKIHKKLGDSVNYGDVLLEYYCSDKNKIMNAKLYIDKTIMIENEVSEMNALIVQ
jgi:pyrimidine-nucleoside phosphorylase